MPVSYVCLCKKFSSLMVVKKICSRSRFYEVVNLSPNVKAVVFFLVRDVYVDRCNSIL